ncbi:MAG: DUF63 family protein [Methanophagales archaeon]|nr:DUF63 family protein [Methanophagales archaeon]
MIEALRHFLDTYYIKPIFDDLGYNWVNTMSWALLFALFVLLALLKILKKIGIEIDEKFIAAVVPYILVGATMRVIEDAELIVPPLSYLLITPLIYFLVFVCGVFVLLISIKTSKTNYNYIFGAVGLIWFFANLSILLWTEELISPWVILAVSGISAVIVGVIYLIAAKFDVHFLTDKLNISVLAAHLLDATSTYIGIDILGDYIGKHVIENLIVKYTGSAVGMYLLKLGILIPVLYLMDTQFHEEEKELKNIVLLALITIGLAPAVRNTLRMAFGI